MGFIMDGLGTGSIDRTYSDKELLKKLLGLFSEKYLRIIFIAVLITVKSILGTASVVVLSKGIDFIFHYPTIGNLAILSGILISIGLIVWGINLCQRFYTKKTISELLYKVQTLCFEKVITKRMSFFDNITRGQVISRITGDSESLNNLVNLIISFVYEIFLLIILLIAMFIINLKMSLILIALVPFIVLTALSFRKVAREVSIKLYRVIADLNINIKETMNGIFITKNFCKEEFMFSKFDALNNNLFKVNLSQGYVFSTILPLMSLLTSLGTALVLYFGINEVLKFNLSFGELYLFVQVINLIWTPISSLSSFWSQFQDGLASFERIFSLIDDDSYIRQKEANKITAFRGEIVFDKVCMCYEQDHYILDNLSLHINPGKKIALVGNTGCGKTTLIRLILRFYEYQQGSILIDNHDIRTLDLHAYRKKIGYVPQVPFIFSGTILDNILYGNESSTREDVLRLINTINDGDLLSDFSDGLDTVLIEGGRNISLGQRQLICLLRVFLSEPVIFLLDEATASIDPYTEYHIHQILKELIKNRTSIIIAHRLSTVKIVDEVVVVSQGKITEQGTHEELLKMNKHYGKLYDKYFKYQSIDDNADMTHAAD